MRKFFSISVSELIEVIVSDLTFNTSSKIWESFVVVFPSDSKTLSPRHKKETLQADEINKKDHREKLSLSISYFFLRKKKNGNISLQHAVTVPAVIYKNVQS